MLSINTNLSSLIAQNSLNSSTNKLSLAVERMSTGYKINHAKDNAANYSISTNMTTKIGAYQVAEDNAAMGLDMLTTASESLGLIENKLARLRSLAVQAQDGTFVDKSLEAIQTEADAISEDITKLYISSEYNGISLFSDEIIENFVMNPITYNETQIIAMNSIKTFSDNSIGEFKIETVEDLVYLAEIVNDKNWDTSNATFVLANDIDLASYCEKNGNWKPIGINSFKTFKGCFNGNGNVISNLRIEDTAVSIQGLFGYVEGGSIANVGIENGYIKCKDTIGILIGSLANTSVINCYTTGKIDATGSWIGGLIGSTNFSSTIENCYSSVDTNGEGNAIGGLVGLLSESSLINNYAVGNISGNNMVGGLLGQVQNSATITSSYATGNVDARTNAGGLIGYLSIATIDNSYATGNITLGTYGNGAGLVGIAQDSFIKNSFATGQTLGQYTNGLVGKLTNTAVSNSASVETDPHAKVLTEAEIKTKNNLEAMGFTKNRGWDITKDDLPLLKKTTVVKSSNLNTKFLVSINGDNNALINFKFGVEYNLDNSLFDILSDNVLNTIDEFIYFVSKKQTELGSVSNRLESVLDEISTQYENLVSSRSTLRDADIAKESSAYIQQQILQQASATLLATANQSPAIALQLI